MASSMLLLAVEHADAGRPVELVAGEGIEVAIEVLHVDREMHRALAAVDQHGDAAGMRDPDHLLDRHDGAEHVRHVGDGDHLGARGEQRLELVEQKARRRRRSAPISGPRPAARAWKCQGTMLEWCSMIESTISSPSPMTRPP